MILCCVNGSIDQSIVGKESHLRCDVMLTVICLYKKRNKNLCGRDGRTICGPQCVPKSTCVSL